MKNIISWLSTTAGILAVAVFIIQLQCGRIDKLQREKADLRAQAAADSIYKAALGDTIKAMAQYEPLPETLYHWGDTILVPVPIPDIKPPDTAGGPSRAFLTFYTRDQWELWYRQSCTGVIQGSDSTIWENGAGARVDYELYYGFPGADTLGRIVILPCGAWRPPLKKKPGFGGGLAWFISNKGDLSVGADITWRKWGPTARIDFLHDDKPTYWGGVRRNF